MNPFTIIGLNLVCTMKEFIHTQCYQEEVLFGYMWSQKKSFLVICDPRRSPFLLYVIPEEVLFGYMWSQKKSFLVICDPMVMIDYTLHQNMWWIISWIMYHRIHSLHVTSLNQWVRVKCVGVGNQCYINVSWLMGYVTHLELIFIGITSYRTVDDDDF